MRTVTFAAAISLLLLCTVACGTDPNLPDQRAAIVNYLDRNRIIYSTVGGVYKYVPNTDRPDYEEAPLLETGDEFEFHFEIYAFGTSGLAEMPFFSNKRWIIEKMVADYGLNPQEWPQGPERAVLGQSRMIEGLRRALPDSRQGDSVVMFIPSELAYDDDSAGVLPPNSPIVFIVNVDKVTKQ